jgi:CheY-like chemotaxis protein
MSHRTCVLLVDDDADFRAIVAVVLAGEGCIVHEASNGREALQLLKLVLPDLIIMDLMMPVMNGWDLYAELQKDQKLADVPTAVLSAVGRLRPYGSLTVLKKPLDLGNLIALLDTVDNARVQTDSARFEAAKESPDSHSRSN